MKRFIDRVSPSCNEVDAQRKVFTMHLTEFCMVLQTGKQTDIDKRPKAYYKKYNQTDV